MGCTRPPSGRLVNPWFKSIEVTGYGELLPPEVVIDGIRSLVRGFTCPGVHLSVVSGFTYPGVHLSGVHLSGVHSSGGSLVRGFTCPYFSPAITFWFGSAIPRVRHFHGAPSDSISENFAPRTVTHRYTTQQVSNAIHFTAGQHRYHSAGQQRNTNQSTLNRNLT